DRATLRIEAVKDARGGEQYFTRSWRWTEEEVPPTVGGTYQRGRYFTRSWRWIEGQGWVRESLAPGTNGATADDVIEQALGFLRDVCQADAPAPAPEPSAPTARKGKPARGTSAPQEATQPADAPKSVSGAPGGAGTARA